MVWDLTVNSYQLLMNNQSVKKLYSQFKKIPITLVSLSCLCITLTSCGTQTKRVTLASGSNGSGYQQISQQIIESAQEISDLKLQDNYNSQGSLDNLERLLQVKEPQEGLKQINKVEQQFKEMLLTNEVDIETYILIKQLILILIMCFVPQTILTDNGVTTDELMN